MGRNMYVKHIDGDDRLEDIGYHPNCLWGVIHALDYHHWNYVKKFLHHNKPKGRRLSKGKGNPKASLLHNSQELQQLLGGSESQVLVQQSSKSSHSANKGSLKARFKAFSKRRSRRKQESDFPPTPRLLRTYSIHHLEPSDRRLDRIHTRNKPANASQRSAQTEVFNKAHQSEQANVQKRKSLSANQLKKGADIHKAVGISEEWLQDIIGNADYDAGRFLQMLPDFSRQARFTKSGSFPSADMWRRMNFSPSKLENKLNETWVSAEGQGLQSGDHMPKYKKHFRAKSWNFTPENEEGIFTYQQSTTGHLKNEEAKSEAAAPSEECQETKQDETEDISEGGTMHSSPVGVLAEQHPRDTDDETDSSCSYEIDEHSDEKKRNFFHRRSSSLSDSLERYSRLFEFTSRQEVKLHSFRSLKLRNEYDQASVGLGHMSFTRIRSLSHLDFYYSFQKEDPTDAQHVSVSLETVQEDSPFVEGNTQDEEFQESVQENSSRETSDANVGRLESIQTSGNSDILSSEASTYRHDFAENTINEMMERSPINQEEDVSFLEDTRDQRISESLQLDKGQKQSDESESTLNSEQRIDGIVLSQIKPDHKSSRQALDGNTTRTGFHEVHMNDDEADLYFMRELLERSGLCENETLLSAEQPLIINDSVFEEMEADCHQGFESTKVDGRSLHHQLLFDMVNEGILHLYDRAFVCYPKALSSSCHVRPMPPAGGNRLLEEIIITTSGFLSRKAKQNQALDDIVSQDLAKDDGWMNLQLDSECVALELEDMIADELLEELLFAELVELR